MYLGRISAFELGFLPGINAGYSFMNVKKKGIFYFLGLDNYDKLEDNAFIVYQGFLKVNTKYLIKLI